MNAFVAGVGHTAFGRRPDCSLAQLATKAARSALEDAGIAPADVQMVAFGNAGQGALEGQYSIRGQLALRGLGLSGCPIYNVDNACAGGSSAFQLACAQVAAGLADVALAVGAEKMVTEDRARAFAMLGGSWAADEEEATLARLRAMGADLDLPPEPEGPGHSPFMEVYAGFARFHMQTFGTTKAQVAAVAAKNHAHSVDNPLAHYRKSFSVEEILAARHVVYPFTVPMCSPVSDGAAAAVVISADRYRRGGAASRTIGVRACLLASGDPERSPERYEEHACRRLALRAYETAGIAPEDIDVAEVHDATAFGEIMQLENLGFCAFGEGGRMAERGETTYGGKVVVNPSGGLESRGHPVGATGLAQIHELVTQLRHEAGPRQVAGARIAVAENGGGLVGIEEAAASIVILG